MSKSTSRDTRNETLATLPPGQWRIHFSDFRTMRFWHEDEPAHASVRWNRRFPGRSTIQFADGGSIMLELWLQSRPAEHRPRAATLYELAKEAGRKAKAAEAGTGAVEPATQDCGCRAAATALMGKLPYLSEAGNQQAREALLDIKVAAAAEVKP
jgi:hypothetical protein